MKISIVTPSHKQLEWLRLCTASISDQKGVSFEHIIQDACSGQEHTEWVQANTNSKLFVEKDLGMYDAINRGFKKATGDIVAWLNCDEQYLPGTLAKVASFFETHPKIDILFGDAILLDEQGTLLSYRRAILPTIIHTKLAHLNTLSCAMFMRRSVIDRGFFLDIKWKAIADAVLVADLIKAKFRMATLPEPLATFTITEENLGQTSLALKEGERWQEQTTKAWYRKLRSLVVAFHRLRKFVHGAYAIRSLTTEIYTMASPNQRIPVSSNNLSFAWKTSKESRESKRGLNVLFTFIASLFGSHRFRQTIGTSLPFTFYHATRWPYTYWLSLPILLTLFILFLEHETSAAIIVAPMLSTILMLLLSLRLEPRQLVPFAIAFCGAIYVSIHYMQPFDSSSFVDWTRMALRLSTFLAASMLAVLFSKSRCQANFRLDQTLSIITSMPTPVIISDALGNIIFANDEAVEFTGKRTSELIGASFPQLFMAGHADGDAMRDYIRFFHAVPKTDTVSMPRKQNLCLIWKNEGLHSIEARFICLGQGESRYMVTVIKV